MKLPIELSSSALYSIGVNPQGQPEATVVCRYPYVTCPECQTVRSIIVVNHDGHYRCAACARPEEA